MITATLRISYLLFFIIIASQGIFYLTGISKALLGISLEGFIEQRKAIDAVISTPLRVIYYSALITGLLLTLTTIQKPTSLLFITTIISFLCLSADVYLIVTQSLPLNKIVNDFPLNSDSINFETIRVKWLTYINYRGMFAITGLLVLLSGFILEKK
jgi:hypothetical protein